MDEQHETTSENFHHSEIGTETPDSARIGATTEKAPETTGAWNWLGRKDG